MGAVQSSMGAVCPGICPQSRVDVVEAKDDHRNESRHQELLDEPEPVREVYPDPPTATIQEPLMVQACEPIAHVPPIEQTENKDGWSCPECTLDNSPFAEVCEVCGHQRFREPVAEPFAMQPPEYSDQPVVVEPRLIDEDAFTNGSAGGDPYISQHGHAIASETCSRGHSRPPSAGHYEVANNPHLTLPGSRSHSRQNSGGHYQDADGDFGQQASHVSHAWNDRSGPRELDVDSNFEYREPIAAHSRQLSHASDWGAAQPARAFAPSRPLSRQVSSGTTRNALSRQTAHHAAHAELRVAQLRLKILRAHDLRNTGLGLLPGDVSDPFVVARLGSQEFKTSIISNNLNPVWNSPHFEFDILADDTELHLEVFSSNQWHADDSLGKIEVLVQNLEVNKIHKIVTRLNEGAVVRPDQKHARLEVEVQRVDPRVQQQEDLQQVRLRAEERWVASRAGIAREQALLSSTKLGRLPLPSFHSMGPEAFQAPAPQQQPSFQGLPEYVAQTSSLGQYDYSQQTRYHPKQEQTCRKSWKEDPFYGWRSQNEPQPDLVGPTISFGQHRGNEKWHKDPFHGSRCEVVGGEKWHKDPFHGWFQHDTSSVPVDENYANYAMMKKAQEGRQVKRIPSFGDQDVKRFDDKLLRDKALCRKRWSEDCPEDQQTPEKAWKDDAFFGWLPGRGPANNNLHGIPRPFSSARLNRLPSFSEDALKDEALCGITGRGTGILRLRITRATNLSYGQAGRSGAPSACVRLQVGKRGREVDTATVHHDRNPCWNTSLMPFELTYATDRIYLKVLDKEPLSGSEHILGEASMPLGSLLKKLQNLQPEEALIPYKLKLELGQKSFIKFEVLWEAYQEDEGAVVGRLSKKNSFISTGEMVEGQIGILSVRVIAAFDLVNKDSGWFGDYSDPFVKVWLNSQSNKKSKQTKTIDNDLNPVWNSTPFLFHMTMLDDQLHLEVFNENRFTSHDFLGKIMIHLGDVEPHEPIRKREKLLDIDHGELEFEITFCPDEHLPPGQGVNSQNSADFMASNSGADFMASNNSAHFMAVGMDLADGGGRCQATPDFGDTVLPCSKSGIPPRSNSGIPESMSDHGAFGQLGILSVRIVGAFNLVNMDSGILGDVSDPFVQFWLVSQSENSQKTKTINNDLNPVWNTDPYSFPITTQDDLLHLEVWDEDTFTANDLLGRLTIPLYNIVCGEPNQTIRIRDHLQDTKHGELEVEVAFSPSLG